MAKVNPFDYTNSINQSKKNLMRGTANDVLAEKSYSPWLTNRALSYHSDTIYFANEMNIRHQLDNLLQYSFLLNIVRPKKRHAKWAKKDNDGDVLIVKEYFGYNDTKARQAVAILTDEQLSEIRKKLLKGGRDDRKHGGSGAS
jgi:hypothetical protein